MMKTTVLVLARKGRQYEVRNTGVVGVESVLHTLMTIPARLKVGLEYQITRLEGGQVTSVKTMMGKVLYQQRPRLHWWPFRRPPVTQPVETAVHVEAPTLDAQPKHRVFDMVSARWQKRARVQVKKTRVEFFLTEDGYAFMQVDELPFCPVNPKFMGELAGQEFFCVFSHGDSRVLLDTKGVMRVWRSFLDLTPSFC